MESNKINEPASHVDIKRMSIKEFREKGYLQELNRRFLHPLGLALETTVRADGTNEKLGGIWDFRNDPEGILYGDFTSVEYLNKSNFIDYELDQRVDARDAVGCEYGIQKIKVK